MQSENLFRCLPALLLLSLAATHVCCDTLHGVLAYSEARIPQFQQDLLSLAAIPTISALPEHRDDILKAADWLKHKLTVMGMENAEARPVIPTVSVLLCSSKSHVGAPVHDRSSSYSS